MMKTLGCIMTAIAGATGAAQIRVLGNGFMDHGPFADVAVSRGTVCTTDGEGRNVVLVWLFDSRYAYGLGVIDAETGAIKEIPRPIERDCPFASLLSSNGRYYTYMGGHFLEFDPLRREFSFIQKGPARVAMSMTEDDNGCIWAALYPHADVVSYDSATGKLHNWGPVSKHPSAQYPRSMAADDQGWLYIAIGLAVGQIFMLNPQTGQVTGVIPQADVVGEGLVEVQRATDGKAYGVAPIGHEERTWFELHGGEATILEAAPAFERKRIITGSQGLRHYDLPNGERVRELNLAEGRLVVEDPKTGTTRELTFEISGGGSSSMGLTVAQDGTIAGGTYHPKRFFSYSPRTDEWIRRECYGQWNVVATTSDRFYIASYTEGVLLEWDPKREWVPTERDKPDSNPRYLAQTLAHPHVGRPYTILAHPDGRHVIYGGTPGYGYTGGGLVFYNVESETAEVITHDDLVPWHSQASVVALADGTIVGGTSVEPGMGGVPKAEVAELYILDMVSRKVRWRSALIADARRYNDMIVGLDGKVFGIVDRARLFVFDPEDRTIVHLTDLEAQFGQTVHQQGPRVFVQIPDGRIFMLFVRGIVELNPQTYDVTMLAAAPRNFGNSGAHLDCSQEGQVGRSDEPQGLGNGGAYLDGRIYFAGGVNLFSWQVPPAEQ